MTAAPGRLRVAHVSLGLDTGGQEKLLVEFARHADHTRFDVTVVSLTTRGVLGDAIAAAGARVVARGERPGLRPGMLWRLARFFRAERFDVVHTHDDKPLVYAAPAAWLARVSRRLHTHHHGLVGTPRGRQNLLLRTAARTVDPFVCVSHDAARHVVELGVPAGRVRTIWNGIDLARFPYQGPTPGGPAVCVARLSPEKDIATLLDAARRVADAVPDLRLEIAGDGPCRADLARQCKELKLHEHVRLLGEVRDVPALLGRAGLFVLPSQAEGVSLTILEAMARGLPVVTTRVGGNPEVVADGSTGLLVPPRDPAALADALVRVLRDADRAQALGRAGRRRVEDHFDVRRMVADYEALYAPAAREPAPMARI
jgi:glycosyltransferase involved in cell wall biosynthesis